MAGLTRGWLNADAPLNMPCMEGTLEVSTLSGWLNAFAPLNMRRIVLKHALHACDAGGVPVGYVRVKVLQAIAEVAQVRDGRDVPVGDGAVRCIGDNRVRIKGLDRSLQLGLARKGVIGQAAVRRVARNPVYRAVASKAKGGRVHVWVGPAMRNGSTAC
eukprot:scaffold5300_cov85-Phaeocystis_antarctica.AAC.1